VFTAHTDFLGPVRLVERRVVLAFADPAHPGVELLPDLVGIVISAIRFEQAQATVGQHHALVVVADRDGLDQPLLAQVVE
jgi:hypothetical protein